MLTSYFFRTGVTENLPSPENLTPRVDNFLDNFPSSTLNIIPPPPPPHTHGDIFLGNTKFLAYAITSSKKTEICMSRSLKLSVFKILMEIPLHGTMVQVKRIFRCFLENNRKKSTVFPKTTEFFSAVFGKRWKMIEFFFCRSHLHHRTMEWGQNFRVEYHLRGVEFPSRISHQGITFP